MLLVLLRPALLLLLGSCLQGRHCLLQASVVGSQPPLLLLPLLQLLFCVCQALGCLRCLCVQLPPLGSGSHQRLLQLLLLVDLRHCRLILQHLHLSLRSRQLSLQLLGAGSCRRRRYQLLLLVACGWTWRGIWRRSGCGGSCHLGLLHLLRQPLIFSNHRSGGGRRVAANCCRFTSARPLRPRRLCTLLLLLLLLQLSQLALQGAQLSLCRPPQLHVLLTLLVQSIPQAFNLCLSGRGGSSRRALELRILLAQRRKLPGVLLLGGLRGRNCLLKLLRAPPLLLLLQGGGVGGRQAGGRGQGGWVAAGNGS